MMQILRQSAPEMSCVRFAGENEAATPAPYPPFLLPYGPTLESMADMKKATKFVVLPIAVLIALYFILAFVAHLVDPH